MSHYDHRVHAGNAGDVWKHFLLLEVADCLLTPDSRLVYAESHVGRPYYSLKPCGDWEGGIGRIWPTSPLLRNFSYFDILAELCINNSTDGSQIDCYPGSALLVARLAERKRAEFTAEIWDIDPAVGAAWRKMPLGSFIYFHLGDGFSGVMSLLEKMEKDNTNKASGGLLLIDPPFTDPGDRSAAEKLFFQASRLGWTVLFWSMDSGNKEAGMQDDSAYSYHDAPQLSQSKMPFNRRPPSLGQLNSNRSADLSIQFSQIGLKYPGAEGCSVRVASPDSAIIGHISQRIDDFKSIINESLFSKSPILNDDKP